MSLFSEILADSPWGAWRFADLTDSSGGGHSLTAGTGSPALAQASFLTGDPDGHAVSFDGTNDLNLPGEPSAALTVEFWVRGASTNCVVLGNYPSWKIGITSGFGPAATPYAQQDSGGGTAHGTSGNVADGAPHHIALVWSDQTTVGVYLDGALVGSGVAIDRGGVGSGGSLGGYGAPPWYAGLIQGLAVYETALSAGRILAHYHAGVATTWAGTAAGAEVSGGHAAATLMGAVQPSTSAIDAWWTTTRHADWWGRNPYQAEVRSAVQAAIAWAFVADVEPSPSDVDAWWASTTRELDWWQRNPYQAEAKAMVVAALEWAFSS